MFKRVLSLIFVLLIGCHQSSTVEPEPPFDVSWCSKTYMENRETQQLDFPINVYINSHMSDENIEAAILAAAAWNATMGAPVFTPIVTDRPVDRSVCGSVFVSTSDLPKDYVGYAWWDSCSAQVKFEPDQDREDAINVMIHELGHSLNLNHEEDELSIMHDTLGTNQEISDLSECLVELALREVGVD